MFCLYVKLFQNGTEENLMFSCPYFLVGFLGLANFTQTKGIKAVIRMFYTLTVFQKQMYLLLILYIGYFFYNDPVNL